METPETVQPGQVWQDNDRRTKGAGDFTVAAVVQQGEIRLADDLSADLAARVRASAQRLLRHGDDRPTAIVHRSETDRLTRISVNRLLLKSNQVRGYTYLGMSR